MSIELYEQRRVGRDYLATVTTLLQRVRNTHPTAGLYQAAELQFWWVRPRRTDGLSQLFWFGNDDQPVAGAVLVDFANGSSLIYDAVTFCPFVVPGIGQDVVETVVDRGLEAAREAGFERVDVEVDQADSNMHQILTARGFSVKEPEVLVECWMDAAARPAPGTVGDEYRLVSRAEVPHLAHHMLLRNPTPHFEERLRQASLYRPDMDLVVLDADDEPAAWGLFWYDSASATGVVEPMRTVDAHQRKGLARHVLTNGVERLAQAGATRISIGYEPENPASGRLYRSVGFEPVTTVDLWSGPTS